MEWLIHRISCFFMGHYFLPYIGVTHDEPRSRSWDQKYFCVRCGKKSYLGSSHRVKDRYEVK